MANSLFVYGWVLLLFAFLDIPWWMIPLSALLSAIIVLGPIALIIWWDEWYRNKPREGE